MFPSPAGLNPVDGITMRAQTILHREILHLHGLLILAISLLRTRFAILNPSFMDYITSPHIHYLTTYSLFSPGRVAHLAVVLRLRGSTALV